VINYNETLEYDTLAMNYMKKLWFLSRLYSRDQVSSIQEITMIYCSCKLVHKFVAGFCDV
jgi:hypothetical protein